MEIKINLPATKEDYENGNGEGCFAIIHGAAVTAYNNDDETGIYAAILDNNSLYYPALHHGDAVPIEMRGENRPVVPLDFLEATRTRTKRHAGGGKVTAKPARQPQYITRI